MRAVTLIRSLSFLRFKYPNGKHRIDTLECTLADKRGNWYGSGLGISLIIK